MDKGSENRVKDRVEVSGEVLYEKTQDNIPVLLEQLIFAPIAAVCDGIGEMLRPVEFDDDARIVTQQINLHPATAIERYRQLGIQVKASFRFLQRFEAAIQKRL